MAFLRGVTLFITPITIVFAILTFLSQTQFSRPDLKEGLLIPQDGNVQHLLSDVAASLKSLRMRREMTNEVFDIWLSGAQLETWAEFELRKLTVWHEKKFIPILDETIPRVDKWVEDWGYIFDNVYKDLEYASAEIKRHQAIPVQYADRYALYYRMLPMVSDSRLEHDTLCNFAAAIVSNITDLLQEFPDAFGQASDVMHDYLGMMRHTAYTIFNTTGSTDWQASFNATNGSCLHRGKTLAECGSEKQKKVAGLLQQELYDHQEQVRIYKDTVRRVVEQLHRVCKKTQAFQLGRECMAAVSCGDRGRPKPIGDRLPPDWVIRYISGWLFQLFWMR